MAEIEFTIDALVPQAVARKAERIGVAKVNFGRLVHLPETKLDWD